MNSSLAKVLCIAGVHWSGTVDGGGMGDCMRCDWCGKDKYPEVFSGRIVHGRSLADPLPADVVKHEEKCHATATGKLP